MKKHIHRKFLNQVQLTPDIINVMKASNNGMDKEELKNVKVPKGYSAFITTTTNQFLQAFTIKHKGKEILIPEPDPILVYFHTAYCNYINLERQKNEILEKINKDILLEELMTNELFTYFSTVSSFVIFLFTSLEATINRCIPIDFVYKQEHTKKTEIYTKQQIERYLPFDEKLKKILPIITGKNFEKQYNLKYQFIINLKNFRDSIVHTKSNNTNDNEDIHNYKRAFNYNFKDTINAVKDFCNYYLNKPNFIEDCPCDNDW